MVSTIPDELREALDADRYLLKVLMDTVSRNMKKMVEGRRGAVPGIVYVLHIYGRDLKLNLHVHVFDHRRRIDKAG